jgi:hypothetical protein
MPKVTESTPVSPNPKSGNKGDKMTPSELKTQYDTVAGKNPTQKVGNGQPTSTTEVAYAQQEQGPRKVLYPEGVRIKGIDPVTWMTRQQVEEILWWETEEKFAARLMAENPKRKAAKLKPYTTNVQEAKEGKGILAAFGEDYTVIDENGDKVKCWNSIDNRPIREGHAKELGQDVLNRKWAGATGKEGDTVNGHTAIIGRTGKVLNNNHTFIGFVLACQRWEKEPHHKDLWPEEPKLPVILVTGVSEEDFVVRTLDNTLARTGADVIYTSGMFRETTDPKGRKRALNRSERLDLSRMLSKATEVLWERTRAFEGGFTEHLTHGERVEFIEKHYRLLKCVQHVYQENTGKKSHGLTSLHSSPGTLAAMLYLMGCCASDWDVYADPSNKMSTADRNEKDLDWEWWDKAKEFIALLASKDSTISPIRDAHRVRVGDEDVNTYGGLVFSKEDGADNNVRLATICKAWNLFARGEDITEEDVRLAYKCSVDSNGVVTAYKLLDKVDVGGIDCGEPVKKEKELEGDVKISGGSDEVEPLENGDPATVEEESEIQERIEAERASKEQEQQIEETPEQEKARRAAVENGNKEKPRKKIVRKA